MTAEVCTDNSDGGQWCSTCGWRRSMHDRTALPATGPVILRLDPADHALAERWPQ